MVEHLSVEIELVFEAEWLLSGRGALGARHGRVLIVTAEQIELGYCLVLQRYFLQHMLLKYIGILT